MLLRKGIALLAIGFAIVGTSTAQAANLVQNGGFENFASGAANEFLIPGLTFRGQAELSNWTYDPAYVAPNTPKGVAAVYSGAAGATTTGATVYDTRDNPLVAYDQIYLWSTNNGGADTVVDSKDGGNFLASDADGTVDAAKPIEQSISGLVVGATYALHFEYAGAQFRNSDGSKWTGGFHAGWQVSFGGDTKYTGGNAGGDLTVGSKGFTGWKDATFFFTATSTTETLSFLAVSDAGGLPPVSLLDGVTLSYVPEPSSFAMTAIALAGFGALRLRRKQVA